MSKDVREMNNAEFREYLANLGEGKKPKNGVWTPRQLVQLTFPECWAIWKDLPAPDFFELTGEFNGLCPDGKDRQIRIDTVKQMFTEGLNYGYWLGKAMRPYSATGGFGYNVYRQPGEWIDRRLRFSTEMGVSLIDGKPAFVMHYDAFCTNAGKAHLTDEIRKLDKNIYMGMGHIQLPNGERSLPSPFILMGPTRPFYGVEDEDAERWPEK